MGSSVRLATACAPSPTEAPQWALSRRGRIPGAPRVLYRNTNSHALFAAEIQSFVRENMALSAVSTAVSSSWLLRAAAFQKAPFKMTFAGSNPPCPASQCGLSYSISGRARTADIPRVRRACPRVCGAAYRGSQSVAHQVAVSKFQLRLD
jgi:hypothetical protein